MNFVKANVLIQNRTSKTTFTHTNLQDDFKFLKKDTKVPIPIAPGQDGWIFLRDTNQIGAGVDYNTGGNSSDPSFVGFHFFVFVPLVGFNKVTVGFDSGKLYGCKVSLSGNLNGNSISPVLLVEDL